MVDWAALGQVVWVAFAASLTLALAYTGGVVLVGGASVPRRAVGVGLFGLCLALTVVGLYVLFDKQDDRRQLCHKPHSGTAQRRSPSGRVVAPV